jgi:hypothetical protein
MDGREDNADLNSWNATKVFQIEKSQGRCFIRTVPKMTSGPFRLADLRIVG